MEAEEGLQGGGDGCSANGRESYEEEGGAAREEEGSNASVLAAVVEAIVGVPAHITSGGTCHLTPSTATTNPTTLGTNLLHDIDQAAQVRLRFYWS